MDGAILNRNATIGAIVRLALRHIGANLEIIIMEFFQMIRTLILIFMIGTQSLYHIVMVYLSLQIGMIFSLQVPFTTEL